MRNISDSIIGSCLEFSILDFYVFFHARKLIFFSSVSRMYFLQTPYLKGWLSPSRFTVHKSDIESKAIYDLYIAICMSHTWKEEMKHAPGIAGYGQHGKRKTTF